MLPEGECNYVRGYALAVSVVCVALVCISRGTKLYSLCHCVRPRPVGA